MPPSESSVTIVQMLRVAGRRSSRARTAAAETRSSSGLSVRDDVDIILPRGDVPRSVVQRPYTRDVGFLRVTAARGNGGSRSDGCTQGSVAGVRRQDLIVYCP